MENLKNEIYIRVWIHEEEKWYYFKESFDETQFKDAYVDYYITINDGIIIDDTYKADNKGKRFVECYNINDWENQENKKKIISVINGINIIYEDENTILSDVDCKKCGKPLGYGEVIDGYEYCGDCRKNEEK